MTVPAEETEPRPGARALAAASGLARAALHLLYPPTCIACGGATAAPHGLCARCWGGLSLIERPFCERLGTPFAVDLGMPLLSPAAIANPPVFERARALARFDETAQALVHRLKYGDRIELARALGATMARAGAELTRDADVIVPVPLQSWRLWRRRFTRPWRWRASSRRRAACRGPVPPRPRQAHASADRPDRAQRADNLQGAFRIPPEAKGRVHGRRALLVDDVLTTGATTNAAARALLRGGASAGDVLAFARVVTEA